MIQTTKQTALSQVADASNVFGNRGISNYSCSPPSRSNHDQKQGLRYFYKYLNLVKWILTTKYQ